MASLKPWSMPLKTVVAAVFQYLLTLLGYYMLPWARLGDYFAYAVTCKLREEFRTHTVRWYIALFVLLMICGMHMFFLCSFGAMIFEVSLGTQCPCVCEATMQHARRSHAMFIHVRPGAVVHNTVNLVKALLVFLNLLLEMCLDVVHLVWQHPRLSTFFSAVFLLRSL